MTNAFQWLQTRSMRAIAASLFTIGMAGALSCSSSAGSDDTSGCDESTGPCPLTVTMDPPQASIVVGATVSLTASPLNKNGPIANPTVSWSSDQRGVADVSGSGATAIVTGKSAGTTTIRATSRGVTGTATITVSTVQVATVALSDHQVSLFVGGTKQISATSRDASGNALQNRVVVWSSVDGNVATVSTSGMVTGVSAGTTRIVGTVETHADTAIVVVTQIPVASVTLAPTNALNLAVGSTSTLTATALDANGNTLPGRVATWASADPSIAQVSSSGVVTAIAVGSTSVTATIDTKSASAGVKVTPAQFTITTSVLPAGAGTATGGGTFSAGASDTVHATAASGFQFTYWSESTSVVSTSADYPFTVTANRNLVANFASLSTSTFRLTITGAGIGSGTVTSTPAGINCTISSGNATGACANNFTAGTSVSLSQTSSSPNTFAGWSGACTGTGGCSVSLSATVTATFTAPSALLSVAVQTADAATPGNGTVTSSPSGINCSRTGGTCSSNFLLNSNVSLTATPDAFSRFITWSGACTGTGVCNVSMNAAKSVSALFDALYYPVTANTTGSGAVYSGYLDIECASCVVQAPAGRTIDFAGHPAIGWIFTGFTGGTCSGTAVCHVTITSPITVTANFVQQQPPNVSTAGASSVGRTSATLNGSVVGTTAFGSPLVSTVSYQWGTAAGSLTNSLPAGTQPLDGTTKSWPVTLSGLSPNTTYYFRLTATNPTTGIPAAGITLSFTTAP